MHHGSLAKEQKTISDKRYICVSREHEALTGSSWCRAGLGNFTLKWFIWPNLRQEDAAGESALFSKNKFLFSYG